MIKEFREFITRGNVLDLAVGVIIGGAFTAIVTSLVEGLITPLIGLVAALLTGGKNLDDATKELTFRINGVSFNYGQVISAIITFLITAFVLFLIIKFANKAAQKIGPQKKDEEEIPAESAEDILTDIRSLLAEQKNQRS